MMSAMEGVMEKRTYGRLREFYSTNQIQMLQGGESQKILKLCGHHI